jgi:hypothetical protein
MTLIPSQRQSHNRTTSQWSHLSTLASGIKFPSHGNLTYPLGDKFNSELIAHVPK